MQASNEPLISSEFATNEQAMFVEAGQAYPRGQTVVIQPGGAVATGPAPVSQPIFYTAEQVLNAFLIMITPPRRKRTAQRRVFKWSHCRISVVVVVVVVVALVVAVAVGPAAATAEAGVIPAAEAGKAVATAVAIAGAVIDMVSVSVAVAVAVAVVTVVDYVFRESQDFRGKRRSGGISVKCGLF